MQPTATLTGEACCAAQKRLADVVTRLEENPATQSLSARYDLLVFLPLKTFFILVIIAIGLLLAVWHRRIHLHYRELVPRIERGVIIGALAMLLWLAMDYGYQQTTNVLFGRWGPGPQLRLSLVVAPWVLLLLFYFLTRLGKQGEMIGQISGVIVAAVAILRFENLNDWADRLVGIGTGPVGHHRPVCRGGAGLSCAADALCAGIRWTIPGRLDGLPTPLHRPRDAQRAAC